MHRKITQGYMSKGKLYVAKSALRSILQKTVLTAGLLIPTLSFAEAPLATPADWLARMVKAAANTNYQGHMVYESATGLSTMRVSHALQQGVTRERVIYMDGPYQEIVREDNQIAFIRADGEVNRYRTEGITGLVDRLGGYQDDLRRSYRLMFGNNDRVAGRETLRIDIHPRDTQRYGYALWLDRDTGLLLRSELINDKGAILERLQYVDLTISDIIPEEALKPSRPVTWQTMPKRQNTVPSPEQLVNLDWEAGWLPSGFHLVGISQTDSPVSDHKVDSLLFSDGLASFSIFFEQDRSKVLGPASEQIGATSAVSRLLRQGENYYNVTVIGEISTGVAERIAVSIRTKDAQSPPSQSE